MKGWKQILEDIRAIMLQFPSHFVATPGCTPKGDNVSNRVGAWAIEETLERIRVLEKENGTLKEALAHWQGVVRVAREKDSTLPDPEAVPC